MCFLFYRTKNYSKKQFSNKLIILILHKITQYDVEKFIKKKYLKDNNKKIKKWRYTIWILIDKHEVMVIDEAGPIGGRPFF